MYNLKITKEATEDIDKIIAYITNVLKNPIAADNLLTEFENSFKDIAYNPKMYPFCNDIRLKQNGYRKIPVKNYIIFYKQDVEQDIVYIMRVIYGRRNYTKLI